MLGTSLDAIDYMKRLQGEIGNADTASLVRLSNELMARWENGHGVFVFGNGGSGTTASHFAEDLGKGLLTEVELRASDSRRLRVMSLTDNIGWLLAVGNDLGYDQVFVQQLMNFAQPGDLVIAISGSGNSANVLRAVEWANSHQIATYGFTGFGGGTLRKIQTDGFHIELHDMGMVESIHLCVFHWVLNDVFARIHHCDRYSAAK